MMEQTDPDTSHVGDGAPSDDAPSYPLEKRRDWPHLLDNHVLREELNLMEESDEMDTDRYRRFLGEWQQRRNGARKAEALPEDVVPLFGFDRPEPMKWAVAGLVPQGHLTMLIADGGTGKSYLAVYFALCLATGRPFLGRGVRRCRVLYVDHELDKDEQRRRVWRVAEGMDLNVHSDAIEGRLFYTNPTEPLGTEKHHASISRVVERLDIDFIVLDSLTMGATGDVKDQSDLVPIAQQIRQLHTMLAIDHVLHATAHQSASKARAFGSVFKRNAARSSLTLAEADTGGFVLQQEKSNFNAGDSRLYFAADFTDDAVSFSRIDEADERAASLLSDLSTKDVTLVAVKNLHEDTGEAVDPSDVVTWREERDECSSVAAGTVRNHFTALRDRGEIVRVDGGGARPAVAEHELDTPF
jgi:archaellum biogenesis ATPase FlaH